MKRGLVRIIGGQWRGRRLSVADVAGLRPTPDRVRETLFNWLTPKIVGARCLDAFAGTGVLGFEAASRGAGQVVMTESSLSAWQQLKAHAHTLAAQHVEMIKGTQPKVLSSLNGSFDIVFLDPPWQQLDLLKNTFWALIEQNKLTPGAWVYLEMPAVSGQPPLPAGWRVLKETRAGDVVAMIVACE